MECLASMRSALCGEPVSEQLAADIEMDRAAGLLWRMAQAATTASRAADHLAMGAKLS